VPWSKDEPIWEDPPEVIDFSPDDTDDDAAFMLLIEKAADDERQDRDSL
jgi:hypothetical protein